MSTDFGDFSTDPSIVKVSVKEATAQSGDPGKNCPPLDVVSHSPGQREREEELIDGLHVILLWIIICL